MAKSSFSAPIRSMVAIRWLSNIASALTPWLSKKRYAALLPAQLPLACGIDAVDSLEKSVAMIFNRVSSRLSPRRTRPNSFQAQGSMFACSLVLDYDSCCVIYAINNKFIQRTSPIFDYFWPSTCGFLNQYSDPPPASQ